MSKQRGKGRGRKGGRGRGRVRGNLQVLNKGPLIQLLCVKAGAGTEKERGMTKREKKLVIS